MINPKEAIKQLFSDDTKILVTGSSGFIGNHLCSLLGEQVIRFDLADGQNIFSEDFDKAVSESTAIVHLAGDIFTEDEQVALNNNAQTTLQVLEIAYKYKKKVIFTSTAGVYADTLHNTQRETDLTDPHTAYSRSKLTAEYYCASFGSRIPVTVLRLFNVFGVGDGHGVIDVFSKGFQTGEVFINGDGNNVRDFIHVRDVASVLRFAALTNNMEGMTINVGTGRPTSINEIGSIFNQYSLLLKNRPLKITYRDPIESEIKWSCADNSLLRSVYPNKLTTNIEQDVKELFLK